MTNANDENKNELSSSSSLRVPKCLAKPYYASGEVVKGFGRGSKQLGIPTANFPDEVTDQLPASFDQGVYYGWASIDNGPVYKMVMSIGNNPYYNNEKRTMETHILSKFDADFYGSNLKVIITGHMRQMTSFKSLDDLIQAIQEDIRCASDALDAASSNVYQNDVFFRNDVNSNL